MSSFGGMNSEQIQRRVRACDYITVAQLFLQSDFLLEHDLTSEDIKPRLLGHWGTCHGINVAYANLRAFFSERRSISGQNAVENLKPKSTIADLRSLDQKSLDQKSSHINKPQAHTELVVDPDFSFILGPGHGFPALQANLFLDGDLEKVDPRATRNEQGLAYLCRKFSWPGGFPSHASPITPGVICEGGELGYALGAAYGSALGHPEKTIAVLLGDGELETATALASLNLVKLLGNHAYHGRVLPILHLNGYKISAPTLYARKSERELNELIRGFGYTPLVIEGDEPKTFQRALVESRQVEHPFFILRTEKGATGPKELHGQKIAGNFLAHQIPLPDVKTDPAELKMLDEWLKSYHFDELFNPKTGFTIDDLEEGKETR